MSEPAAPAATPVCPRHTDRVSYTRCQRCDRPACPECQVPAAVGFQCVDCVRDQRRSAPAARTSLGAGLTARRPVVTYTVLAVIVAIYVAQVVAGGAGATWSAPLTGLSADAVSGRLAFYPYLSRAEPWRFLTVGLVHGGVVHIALNGFVLWQVGRQAEAVMGRWRYLAVLALTTVAGSVAILWLTPAVSQGQVNDSWLLSTVGISGAIFGLFGAFLAIEAVNRRPVVRQFVVVLVFAMLGLILPTLNLSWQGHVGGLLAGGLAGFVLAKAPRTHRTAWQVAGLALVAVLLVIATAVRWTQVADYLV